jgi:hypothetical protein
MSEAPSALGQAARACGGMLHRGFRIAVALLLLAAIALGGLAVRLAQGPLPLSFLARMIEDAANTPDQPTRLAVGDVVLAWEAVAEAGERPFRVEVVDIALRDADGRRLAALPRAEIELSLRALLLGRVAPRLIALRGLDLRLMRGTDGAVALDLGTQTERLADANEPPGGGAAPGGGALLPRLLAALRGEEEGPFGRHQLRRVVLSDARLSVADAQLGVTWSVPDLDITLARDDGGLRATGGASLLLGDAATRIGVAALWRPDGSSAALTLARVRPAALAAAAPALAPLALVDAELSLDATLALDAALRPHGAEIVLRLGPGRLVPPGTAGIPIRAATARIAATPERIAARDVTLTLDVPGSAPATIAAEATLTLGAQPALAVTARLPRFDIAQLGQVWPQGLGGAERAWLVPNLTAGIASDIALDLAARLPADLSDLVPERLSVTGRVDQAVVHWLRPMPPAEGARGRFRVDLDTVDVAIEAGRVGRGLQGKGQVRLTDLATRPQHADIALDVAGPLAEVLALLQHPRLKLFDARPLPPPIRESTGAAEAKLSVRFPLLDALPVEAVQIAAEGQIADARIPRLVAGQDVTDARLALAVGNDQLRLSGPVRLAGTTAGVTYEQDFRPGPPTQVIERLRAEGRAEERLLAALGLELLDGRLVGAPPATVAYTVRRNGTAEAAIRADLRDVRLSLPEAGYDKPVGQPGSVEASVRLANERITAIEGLRIEAPGLSARGRVGFAQGQPDRLVLASLALGRTRAAGEVVFARDGAITLTARGAVLDATPLLAEPPAPAAPPAPPSPATRALRLDLGFDRVLLANGRTAEAASLRLDRRPGPAGGRIEALSAAARIGDGTVEATIARRADGRALVLRAADAGALLSAADVLTSVAGGRLAVEARFDEATGALGGTAELVDFRVRDAPSVGRVLQAMTLYGLVDLARGPGLNFSQATVPFTWNQGVLGLADARAFSPSLGVTIKGSIDTAARRVDLEGTVVPAYFFNSLLGNIPLIGRLFSPERGGGVFAATFSARGPMADPQVAVNPLAALTPGFLRGLFGIFDGAPASAPPAGATPPARGADAGAAPG